MKVHALIAHQAARAKRQLELQLLEKGVTVSRSADDLVRYHNKMLLIDREQLFVLGFNWARLDIEKSRSMGIVTKNPPRQEAVKLFQADSRASPIPPGTTAFSCVRRTRELAKFIKGAKKSC